MKWFLVVHILINGEMVPGDKIDGFGSMEMPSEEYCVDRANKANIINKDGIMFNMKRTKIEFTCEQRSHADEEGHSI